MSAFLKPGIPMNRLQELMTIREAIQAKGEVRRCLCQERFYFWHVRSFDIIIHYRFLICFMICVGVRRLIPQTEWCFFSLTAMHVLHCARGQ